jgi:hypothetical protein
MAKLVDSPYTQTGESKALSLVAAQSVQIIVGSESCQVSVQANELGVEATPTRRGSAGSSASAGARVR